jgi:hypothetical protein
VNARPFRLTAPEPSEQELQEAVCAALDALLLPPAFWFSAAIGATRLTPQQAAALVRAGIKRGLPDLFVIAPPAGRLFGIELKKQRNGYLSKTKIVRTASGAPRILVGQVERFAELEAAGMKIAICRSVDEVIAQITRWGIPVRGRVALEQPYRESP